MGCIAKHLRRHPTLPVPPVCLPCHLLLSSISCPSTLHLVEVGDLTIYFPKSEYGWYSGAPREGKKQMFQRKNMGFAILAAAACLSTAMAQGNGNGNNQGNDNGQGQ